MAEQVVGEQGCLGGELLAQLDYLMLALVPLRTRHRSLQLVFKIGTRGGQPRIDLATGHRVTGELVSLLDLFQGHQFSGQVSDAGVVGGNAHEHRPGP